MKNSFIILGLIILSSYSWEQSTKEIIKKTLNPIIIKWVDNLSGDFSFTNNWSYPLGVEMKEDGKAGCADGGFCPQRCYAMLDSNGNVLSDSIENFYQLLDTTHLFHSIQCEAWCYEWAGTDFIEVLRKSKDSIYCFTTTGIATHCSLQLHIIKDICYATIDLNSMVPNRNAIFYYTNGNITIDKKFWKEGIMKAEFSFNFEHKENPKKPIYWKGKIYAKIKTQEKWFTPVNIGEHIDVNSVEEERLTDEQVATIFGKSSRFTPEYSQKFSALRDQWLQLHSDEYKKKIENDRWFHTDTVHVISARVEQFSKSQVRIYVTFYYGVSRWHNYYILLKNYLVNRSDFTDEIFYLKPLEKEYSFTFKSVGHETSFENMKKKLGEKYDEYIGQSIQYRQIYYEEYDLEVILQDESVKYLRKGKPNWLDSENVKKHNCETPH